ncbi:MAG: hypothetical protein QXW98_04925 [Candidatus Caldarchaeum sp.]
MAILYTVISSQAWCELLSTVPPDILGKLSVLGSFALDIDAAIPIARKAKNAMLDSGAFTAFTKGKVIDEEKLIEFAKNHPEFNEVVALDVIGDAQKSLEAARRMKAAGLRPIPVFHLGEDFDYLYIYKEEFHKVGLGWATSRDPIKNFKWAAECFDRAWPCLIHAFGRADSRLLLELPFDSADSARIGFQWTYRLTPRNWSIKLKEHRDITGFVEFWLKFEGLTELKWARVLEPLRQKYKPRERRS